MNLFNQILLQKFLFINLLKLNYKYLYKNKKSRINICKKLIH